MSTAEQGMFNGTGGGQRAREPMTAVKPAASPVEHLGRGIVLIVLVFLFLALIGAFAKAASPEVSSGTLVFFQYFLSLMILSPWLLRRGPRVLEPRRVRLQIVWAVFGLSSQLLLFIALGSIPLLDATLLANASPLFIPIVIWIWMKTSISGGLWLCLLIGFVGIVLILQPGSGVFSWATPLALAAGVCSAIGLVTVSRLQTTEPAQRMLFNYFAMSAVLALPIMLARWSTPDGRGWLLLLGIGASMAAAQILTILAYREASASRLAPFNYSVVIFSALLGWIFWSEVPNLLSWLGVLLVCVGGILSTVRHTREHGHLPMAPRSLSASRPGAGA